MSRAVVLFTDGSEPLFFNDFSGNALKFTGLVENGLWEAVFANGVLEAKDSRGRVYNKTPCTVANIVYIPRHVIGDYNEIIAWAEGAKP